MTSTAMVDRGGCALSVVIATTDCEQWIERALLSFHSACEGLDAEILVVDASSDGTTDRIAALNSSARVLRMPPGTLTPVLWATGFRQSRGRVVAFTIGNCIVRPEWAHSLLSAIDEGATGVGGPLALSPNSRLTDWAVFYLRYSAFLTASGGGSPVLEIAGDNAAYRRDALDRHAASFVNGFWEVDFHRRIRPEGARLTFAEGAVAAFGGTPSLLSFIRQRFAHGCHFGAWRVNIGSRPAWKIAVATPLVPPLLVTRIARRVLSRRSERMRFLLAFPALLALATAWASGETWGALSVRPVTHERELAQ